MSPLKESTGINNGIYDMQVKYFFFLFIELISIPNLINAYWKVEDNRLIENKDNMITPIAIGDGHSDSKNRIYATEFTYDNVNVGGFYTFKNNFKEYEKLLEFFWNGSKWEENVIFDNKKKWDISSTITRDAYNRPIGTVVIGIARNDGKKRLYAIAIANNPSSDPTKNIFPNSKFLEYTWDNSTWIVCNMSYLQKSREYIYQLVVGDARNGGENRIYAGNTFGEISEYVWTGSTWTKEGILWDIENPFAPNADEFPITSLIIDECRADDKKRIYFAMSKADTRAPNAQFAKDKRLITAETPGVPVYVIAEMDWDVVSSTWKTNILSQHKFTDTGKNYYTSRIKTGDGKNIGKKNIYYIKTVGIGDSYIDEETKTSGQLIELSWKNDKWNETVIYDSKEWRLNSVGIGIGSIAYVVGIFDAKNDGKSRIYVDDASAWIEGYGKFREFTWNGNNWDMEIIANEYMQSIIIGQGRNDGKNRIYAAPGYELTYNPVYVEKVNAEGLVPVNNYFNPVTGGKSSIVYKINDYGKTSLKVYSLTGELVKTLFNENKNTGEYTINWDGTNDNNEKVGSGIYLIHLEGPGISETKKIGLVK